MKRNTGIGELINYVSETSGSYRFWEGFSMGIVLGIGVMGVIIAVILIGTI